MSVYGPLRLSLERTFDRMRRQLGRPVLYAVPWQTPSGASYQADLDAWTDVDGEVVSRDPADLSYYTIPALWGADAESLVLGPAGLSSQGNTVAVAKAAYRSQLEGTLMVVTGSLTGDQYRVVEVENAPEGDGAVFVVVRMVVRN